MEAGENMITTLNIHNFRCFQDLSVTKLAPITLLGGRNNSGKSAILEAIFCRLAIGMGTFFQHWLLAAAVMGNYPHRNGFGIPCFSILRKQTNFRCR